MVIYFLRRASLQRLVDTGRIGTRFRLRRFFLLVLLVVVSHTAAMMALEGLAVGDALWLTLTSITTVGYGDLSATTFWGRAATVALIYLLGIWLLAQVAAEYLDFRLDRREQLLKGRWNWRKMHDHLLIINTPCQDSERYLLRLAQQARSTPELAQVPILIVTSAYPDGLPTSLRELGVVHHHVTSTGLLDPEAVGLAAAKFVLVLTEDTQDPRSDSLAFDVLHRVRQCGTSAYVVAECILDENKARFTDAGADAIIRPIRAYPELVVRELAAPGTEQILENLFTHQGDSTYRFDVPLKNVTWADVACALIQAGFGTPLGYIAPSGDVVTNPAADGVVEAQAIIVISHQERAPSAEAVRKRLAAL